MQRVTYPFPAGGMSREKPADQIGPDFAWDIYDMLQGYDNQWYTRGPVDTTQAVWSTSGRAEGMGAAYSSNGAYRLAFLTSSGGTRLVTYFDVGSNTFLSSGLPSSSPAGMAALTFTPGAALTCIRPGLGGGAMFGVAKQYTAGDSAATQRCMVWAGAMKNDRSGVANLTAALNSKTVTISAGGDFLTTLEAGMFLFRVSAGDGSPYYVGRVSHVDSNSQVSLEKKAMGNIANTDSWYFTSMRNVQPHIATGLITYNATSGVVTGAGTKFLRQGIASSDWYFFRASDGEFLGVPDGSAGITDQGFLMYGATRTAGIVMDEEAYYACRPLGIGAFNDPSPVGWITAVFAERQWYANRGYSSDYSGDARDHTNRIWFSELNDPEGLDLNQVDGNYIDLVTSEDAALPIKGMAPCFNGLLIFSETESYLLTGNAPENFTLRKIADDGILDVGAVAKWGESVVWAGRKGVWLYDGARLVNIAERLGHVWHDLTDEVATAPAAAMIARDTLFVDTKRAGGGNGPFTSVDFILCVNLRTGAISHLSNPIMQGAIDVPAFAGLTATTWFVGYAPNTVKLYLLDAAALFTPVNQDVGDSLLAQTTANYPSPSFTTCAYTLGDPNTTKRLRELELDAYVTTAQLNLDVYTSTPHGDSGANPAVTVLGAYSPSGFGWKHQKLRKTTSGKVFAFRFYYSPGGGGGSQFQPRSWRLGYKTLRPGRL